MRGAKAAGAWMIHRTENRNNEDSPAIIVLPDLVREIMFVPGFTFILILSD